MKTLSILIISEILATTLAVLSDAVLIAIIGGIVSIISLLITVLVKNKLEVVSKQIDGHMTKMLDLTEKGSRAEGKLEGKEEAKIEQENK